MHSRHHRTHRASPWFVVAVVALLAAIVAGCGGASGDDAGGDEGSDATSTEPVALVASPSTDIFDTDFVGVCDGVGFDRATRLSQTPGVIHPVLVLAGSGTAMYARSTAVREAWTRTWTVERPDALAEIELVACAEKTSSVQVEQCTGYESDGVEIDRVVNLNEVVYRVSLRAAATGEELAAITITARDDTCPMFVTFTEGEQSVEHDSFDDEAIQRFVEPYVTP